MEGDGELGACIRDECVAMLSWVVSGHACVDGGWPCTWEREEEACVGRGLAWGCVALVAHECAVGPLNCHLLEPRTRCLLNPFLWGRERASCGEEGCSAPFLAKPLCLKRGIGTRHLSNFGVCPKADVEKCGGDVIWPTVVLVKWGGACVGPWTADSSGVWATVAFDKNGAVHLA